ncbi:MAG: Na+/H+ antiporter subunit E [Clostridiales bacterium]|nr:Na+/H+ antiporter subunit E [Clostridiales bacterium]
MAVFILWIVFNSQISWELIAFGAVISLALSFFIQRFVTPRFSLRKQLLLLQQLPGYARYVWLLIKEITLANYAVMRLILSDRDIVVPKLTTFRSQLKTQTARVILADCITLTPGTITVHLDEDEYLVHCLDESMEDGLINSEFEKRLLNKESVWLEEKTV